MNELTGSPPGADSECCCTQPSPALCPSILLSHDGKAFVAHLLGSTSFKGRGRTYRAALANLESLMATHRIYARSSLSDQPGAVRRVPTVRRYVPTIKARLVERFGQLSNRELAARIGLVARDAPSMLSSALSGRGTRAVRCSIAVALNELPSLLWPDRDENILQADDMEYRKFANERLEHEACVAQVEIEAGRACSVPASSRT